MRGGATSFYGLYHVGGNVAEWCHSAYRASLNPQDILEDDPYLREDGGGTCFRVVRGGSWYDGSSNSNDLRTCLRRFEAPTNRFDRIGFRVVLVKIQGNGAQ